MATYVVGDVQGCFSGLQRLLDKVNFNENDDRLCFCGDLVNRGDDSLSVLRFAKSLPNSEVVLGNHDITLLAIAAGVLDLESQPTLRAIFTADDGAEIISWLRKQPLMYVDHDAKWAMVHAGIPPQWSLLQSKKYADQVNSLLINPDSKVGDAYLQRAFARKISSWNLSLSDDDKMCYVTNALTRIRFCSSDGALDLVSKQKTSIDNSVYHPWFTYSELDLCGFELCFGHWAALDGVCDHPRVYALDTGYVWGGRLTMLQLPEKRFFSVAAAE